MLSTIRKQAIIALRNHLHAVHNVRDTTVEQRAEIRERVPVVAAWNLDVVTRSGTYALSIVVDEKFPFSLPVLLADQKLFLKLPHVERSGRLCLLPAQATFDYRDVSGVADTLIEEATRLLSRSDDPTLANDFVEEFVSYWGSLLPGNAPPMYSAIKPDQPSRPIRIQSHPGCITISENDEEDDWVHKWPSYIKPRNRPTGYFIWLPQPLRPDRYPNTIHLAFALLRENSLLEAIEVKDCLKAREPLYIVFAFSTSNGPALGGFVLRCIPKHKDKPLRKGFRDKTVRESGDYESDYRRGTIQPSIVNRCDLEWIFHRGSAGYERDLLNKRVALIGCGSLGGLIAELLLKSGVGQLSLYDPDRLSWDNVGRHVLGARHVGANKALALKSILHEKFPFSKLVPQPQDWRKHPNDILTHDLVISATAVWESNCALNHMLRTNFSAPPGIFCWLEPFAVAGHSLAVLDRGGCLRCGTSRGGVNLKRVTTWAKETKLRAPACGEFFQPYGILQVMPVATVAAGMCIDVLNQKVDRSELRTWVGPSKQVVEHGGEFTPEWLHVVDQGEFMHTQTWAVDPECDL